MRNNPGKNSGGSAQAELSVTRNPQHLWKLRALGLGGGYSRGCSDVYPGAHFTHAMMLTIAAATSGQGRLS